MGTGLTRRSSLRLIGLAMALAGSLAACGGAPPADGSGETPVDGGPAAPTLRPVTGSLAALLPTDVGGETLEIQSAEGEAVFGLLPNADAEAVTEQIGKLRVTPDRLSAALAGDMGAASRGEGVAVLAIRVPGVLFTPSSGPQKTFVSSLLGIPSSARIARATLANKTTTTIVDGDLTTYVFGPTEVIFIARGDEALVEEALRHIPDRP